MHFSHASPHKEREEQRRKKAPVKDNRKGREREKFDEDTGKAPKRGSGKKQDSTAVQIGIPGATFTIHLLLFVLRDIPIATATLHYQQM